MSAVRIAALDIGGTNIKGCLFEGKCASPLMEIPTEAFRGAENMLLRAADFLERLQPFDAIGISTAGQVDPLSGVIRYANDNIPGYTGTDVKAFFENRFGVKTAVLNDVYAAALGEGKYGAAVGERDYLCLTYGTGVGGGLVLDGQPYYGTGNSAGIMPGGIITHLESVTETDCFSGSYERAASASALKRKGTALDPALDNGRAIFAKLEDPKVCAAVDEWLDEIASGICTLIYAYNIPCVILGGGVMEQPYAVGGVRERIKRWLIPGFAGVRVLGAKLGNMAGLYGAASAAEAFL